MATYTWWYQATKNGDTVAAPEWKNLIDNRNSHFADCMSPHTLMRPGTATAADLLAEAIAHQTDRASRSMFENAIALMYSHGDAKLREHIKGIAATHGFSLVGTEGPVILGQ